MIKVRFETARDETLGIVRSGFMEYAPIEVIDMFGETIASFRDDAQAWHFVDRARFGTPVRFFAYGVLIGEWDKLAKDGFEAFDAKCRKLYEIDEAASVDWSRV